MSIQFNDISNKTSFISSHHVHTHTADDYELFTITGVVEIAWQTKVTGPGWNRESDLVLEITVPGIPNGKALRLYFWAPFVTINTVSNDGLSNNAGWAVDAFEIIDPGQPIEQQVRVKIQIAGRDSDGWIHRLGYHITLAGKYIDYSSAGPF
jgi:hypothetical protein